MHAYLLIDDREAERRYSEQDQDGERRDLRRALLRATICLGLLCAALAVGTTWHEVPHLVQRGG